MLRVASFLLLGLAISINYYFSRSPPEMSSSPLSEHRTRFYLFGTPIQHSLSPTFHNALFESLSLPHSYSLHERSRFSTDPSTLSFLQTDRTFGGAAVTMPHKVEALGLMDQLGPEVLEIGSMNTIVVLDSDDPPPEGEEIESSSSEKEKRSGFKLEGRNTDVLGIRNALLSTFTTLSEQAAGDESPWGRGNSGVVIGGGGTTRAAIYALSKLNLSPIYLINRDPTETQTMIDSFPQYRLIALRDEAEWKEEEAENCVVVVGAIPSLEPETEGEKNVYRVAERVFDLGSRAPGLQRRFLDMAYKPHVTRMIKLAKKYNWLTIGGIEALVHQALAQQHYWLLDPRAATFVPELAAQGKELDKRFFNLAAEQVRRKAGVSLARPLV